ncbi:hypothetical protein AIT66_22525 [Salmonella enterica subsp. salamae]|uniref:Uncharacterized protein n=2 Tax=Salmonella enterica TaxID=28901 RepID=A0A8E6MKY5_SALER|nr:hypothetical protein AIT66_22525 [Salmonella enterica subsp. salamae]HAU3140659.1 hypothetical protein [Salmonella enterica]
MADGIAGRIRQNRHPAVHIPATDAKKPIRQDGLLHLFDAWQFMAGVLPATLRAVAAQRANPLPADLSSSGEHSPTNNR